MCLWGPGEQVPVGLPTVDLAWSGERAAGCVPLGFAPADGEGTLSKSTGLLSL